MFLDVCDVCDVCYFGSKQNLMTISSKLRYLKRSFMILSENG